LAVSPTVHSPVKAYIYMLRLVGVQQKTDSLEINKIVSYNIKWAFGILPLINIVIPVIINWWFGYAEKKLMSLNILIYTDKTSYKDTDIFLSIQKHV